MTTTLHPPPEKPTLPEGWPTLALLLAVVFINIQTIAAAGWGERVQTAPALALLGVVLGLVAARSRLRAIWSMCLMLGIGIEAALLAQVLPSSGPTWEARMVFVFGSLSGWWRASLEQGAVHDSAVLALLLSLLGYLLGFCSSWLVFRLQNGWWPLVANASVGIVHLSYATVESIPPFLISVFVGVLMVASLELHLRRSSWRAIGVPVQGGSAAWTLAAAGGLAGLALLVANQLPAGQINAELAARYQALTEPWKDLQRQVDRLVGGGRGQARPGGGLAFSQSLSPREDFELGAEPVLKVASPQRRYWRTATYDRYTGRTIAATDVSERRLEAGQDLAADPDGGRRRLAIDFTFTILAPSASAAFAADAPRAFSLPIVSDQRQVAWDLAAVRLAAPLQRGQSYTVTSLVPHASRPELAEAPATYPGWLDRYLELPTTLPERVGRLANEIANSKTQNPRLGTANSELRTRNSALERALAIEDYLRGLTYSTRAVVPPPDRDWADFLLFDSRAGYCDYFAITMAVMLRTQGIPARVASGFAPGTWDEQERIWLVRESDAHSWTEAYFPGYGWQTFEPSALRPTPDWPDSIAFRESQRLGAGGAGTPDAVEDLPPTDAPALDQQALAPSRPTAAGLALATLAAATLAAGFALAVLARVWERGLAHEPAPRRRYAHLRKLLAWSGFPLRDSDTPHELARRASASRPDLASALRRLADQHVEATYARRAPPDSAQQTETAWQALRRPLLIAALRRWLAARRASTRRR